MNDIVHHRKSNWWKDKFCSKQTL